MPYNRASHLWPNPDEFYFRELQLQPQRQTGPHCVSTSLGILTTQAPETFQGQINTQDPVSWSIALQRYGMKLAYCPTDTRRLKFYLPELLALDDLFTLSYYTSQTSEVILKDPDASGWICGSHIVVLHRQTIFDPASGTATPAIDHPCSQCFTKRIFRVLPANHDRGL